MSATDEPAVQTETGAETDAPDSPEGDDSAKAVAAPPNTESAQAPRRGARRVLAYGVLPALALLLALGAGFLKWADTTLRDDQTARIESVHAASDGTVALLSYQAATVEKDLGAAADRLTGQFKDSYRALTDAVVIPGAKEQHISATAAVRAAGSVSATEKHAVVLVFVNQLVATGDEAPTSTASSVRVTLDKVDGRWLISDFTPV